jgi:pimeloyl-ACP methyl ester carboxylesterase
LTQLSHSLVLLPGLDGTGLLFKPFIDALNGRAQTQVVSYPVDQTLGYTELEDLVRAALPKTGSFVVLGESFSGPIAIRIAADPPEGMVGVILCVTFARNPQPLLAWMRPWTAGLRVAAVLAVDETSALGRIQMPTLVLRASEDHVVPRAASEHVLRVLPSAQLAEVEGPHQLLLTRPTECAAVVMRFLEKL